MDKEKSYSIKEHKLDDLIKNAANTQLYIGAYNTFKKHTSTCEKCRDHMPSTIHHCFDGFTAGLNVKVAHKILVGE